MSNHSELVESFSQQYSAFQLRQELRATAGRIQRLAARLDEEELAGDSSAMKFADALDDIEIAAKHGWCKWAAMRRKEGHAVQF